MQEKPRILIVDDNALVSKGIEIILKKSGYETETAETGQKALEKAKERFFNIALLDIFLEDMEGIELIGALQKVHPDMAIIMITGHASLETAVQALDEGAKAYITKPFKAEKVLKRINDILEKQDLEIKNRRLLQQIKKELAERKQIEKALDDSNLQWRKTFDSISNAVFLTDKEGKIIQSNKAMIKLCKKPSKKIIGSSCFELLHGTKKPVEDCPFLRTLKTHQKEISIRKTGNQWFEFAVNPVFDKAGNVVNAVHIISDITERKFTEDSLLESEERFRTVVKTAIDAIVSINSRGKIVFWNDAAEAMFGYSADEATGKSLTLIMPQRFQKAHRDGIKQAVSAGNSKIVGTALERIGRKKDGTEFPLELSLTGWESKEEIFFTGILRDITERKKAEQEIKASEHRFKELFNKMSSGVCVYDPIQNGEDFIFKDFNKSAEQIEKIEKKDVIGKSVRKIFSGIVEFGLFDVFKRVWKTGKPEFYPMSLYKDKRISGWRENYVYKLPSGEIVAVYDDVPSRKQAENEIKKKSEQLKALYEVGKKMTSLIATKDELLPRIAEQAAQLLDTDTCNYRIREGDYLVRGGGTEQGMKLMKEDRLKIGESLSGWVAREKKPLIIQDGYSNDPRLIPEHQEIATQCGFKSALGVPMCIDGRVVGVLNIVSKKPRKFTEEDVAILSSFADMAAIVLENARLFTETIKKVSHLKALSEVIKLIAAELKKEDLLPLIAEQANKLLNTDGCNFRLREGDELVSSYGMKETMGLIVKKRVKINESLSGLIAEQKAPLIVENIQKDKRYIKEHREAAKKLGITSFLGVPMITKDEVVGVLHVYSKKKREFSDDDINLLSSFAKQAAIALQNAEYLEKLKQAQYTAVRSEKLASVGKLAAGVTHEILNPVNIISMKIQLMIMKGVEDESLLKELNIVKDQISRIVKISEALLKFSRQRKAEDIKETDIEDVFKDTLLLVEKELLTRKIETKKEFKKNLPAIKADANQLRQVFLNLITNARDAMPEGGAISISTALNTNKDKIIISIKDTGPGIHQNNLPRIFDPFFTTKNEGEGTGLGLSVCYGIIEEHGGRMWAENNQDRGACFFTELPTKGKG
jgi:PAS domain S-box-containing protein